MINKEVFYQKLRIAFPKLKVLSQGQVDSINILLDTAERYFSDRRHIAYLLATTYHETGYTMRPVTEWGPQWYLKSKKYWPFIGRGYVQITWLFNYKRFSKLLGMDFVKYPHLTLVPITAAKIACIGMQKGLFTGVSLEDFFDHDTDDPFNARRIINILDKAKTIENYYYKFLSII